MREGAARAQLATPWLKKITRDERTRRRVGAQKLLTHSPAPERVRGRDGRHAVERSAGHEGLVRPRAACDVRALRGGDASRLERSRRAAEKRAKGPPQRGCRAAARVPVALLFVHVLQRHSGGDDRLHHGHVAFVRRQCVRAALSPRPESRQASCRPPPRYFSHTAVSRLSAQAPPAAAARRSSSSSPSFRCSLSA